MTDGGGAQRLLGRVTECDILRSLLADVTSGTSRVLLLRGEAGVGKSALLDYVAAQASDLRRVHVAGVESDMELAFAGLQQLCAPLMAYADDLPKPQREALGVAFGRGVGPTPDRFLVGLAVLSLLAAAANDEPLLCLIDDAQWLDQVSVQTLAFVARRLMAEPVALIFAARSGSAETLTGLEELAIGALSIGDSHALLDSVVMGPIDERVRDRIVAETRGIPLALLEVPRNVSATELAGGFWNPGVRPSAGQIEEGFVRRIQVLPADTRRLLLVAAAEPVGDVALFLRVAAQLDIPVDALGPAEAAGVIEFGARMRFHHPLVRSAAYRAADLADRRAIHGALAEATDPQLDPDRRAWHAANAAAGPDDAVAAELEASADRAQTRGGVAAAAAFLERATGMTSDPALRVARAIAAAQAKWQAAAPAAAHELLAVAELGPLSELQRAQVARLRAQMEFARSRGGDVGAPSLREPATRLLDAARRLEDLDDELARDAYLEALAAAMYAGRLGEPTAMTAVADAACVAVRRVPKLHRPIDLLLSGMADRIAGGPRAGAEAMRTALELMCARGHRDAGQALRWMTLGLAIVQESATGELWDDELYHQLAGDVVRQARDAGALAVLPPALAYRAGVHVLAGEFTTAATLIEEAASITASTGYAPLRYHALSLAVWRGSPGTAGLLESAAAEATARGEGRVLGLTGYLAAVLYNGLGRYQDAFVSARRACEFEDLGFFGWCLTELIEAAVHTGQQQAAAAALQRLEEHAGGSGTDWGLGMLAGAQALLADDDQADDLFTDAIERLERTRIAVFLARTHLRYGEWLRRMNRRVDARTHLNQAHEMFTRMGAEAFAERARRELTATGEKTRRKSGGSGDALTAQEAQIARLASEGLTNQEIGAQLFISTHTVEWHLRKVFVKLGVTSRRQLRKVSWAS
ncbi:helix-turn-helix transcriptional regulator [Mycolicibacterium holsaticum]|uniref:helix-turn-helix transcriptional regulator n=1 Tax=Mycolicibacterium holsaticum TaxID=152142 RepID=UPI001C7CD2A3|nr:LuxR family transcriptional regulator [Mycolicibacterium holsaticum]MDA4108424.1 LuxR family transcriptional regulator [Mycolicibacterium holsaticum DSM 44478 = JCM 12374]QZA12819.1 AAA family ATPase [Mycolicibacterium holsaticum DSM 44478 = JCM 12374]UNC09706.1 AAA family ATPase [Mycolicibacterium holsaticum DSM 44478 = JCM 12374]